jgi:hypothetical protein
MRLLLVLRSKATAHENGRPPSFGVNVIFPCKCTDASGGLKHCSTSRSQPDLRLHTLKVGFARASVYALADRLDEVAPERTFQESAMGASLPLACMPHYDIRSRPTGRKPIFAVAAPSGHKAALPRSRDGWKADLIILPVSFARKSVRVELLPIAFCQQQSWAAC